MSMALTRSAARTAAGQDKKEITMDTKKTNRIIILTVLMLALSVSFVYAACPTGMIGYWKGEGNTNDEKGLNNGAWTGTVAYNPNGKVGQAFDLNGANYIDLGNSASLQLQTFTAIAWVKSSNTSINTDNYIVGYVPADHNYYGEIWSLRSAGGQFGSLMWYNGWQDLRFGTFDTAWHQLAITYDGSTETLYVDGANVNSIPTSIHPYTPSGYYGMRIGAYAGVGCPSCPSNQWNGQIDEVALFNTALSQPEIQQLYNNSLQGIDYCERAAAPPEPEVCNNGIDDDQDILIDCADTEDCATDSACQSSTCGSGDTQGIISYWGFDENQGTSASDSVDSSTATLVNGASWAPGKIGSGARVSVEDQRIVTNRESNFDFEYNKPFTFEFWMNWTDTDSTGWVIGKTPGPFSNGYWVDTYPLNPGQVNIRAELRTMGNYMDRDLNPLKGSFHHFVLTYDGSAVWTGLKWYLDGQLQPSKMQDASTVGSSILNDNNLWFMDSPEGGWSVKGTIDEIAVYNRALTQADVLAHYQRSNAGQPYCGEAAPSDTTAPTTTLSISGASQVAGIYTDDISVTLTATDNQGGKGVKETKYRIDSSSWQTGTSFPISCALTCANTVEYYSVDNNDNVEDTKSTVISIDKRAANETVTTSGGTVTNEVGTATVTIPASAYSQPLSFVIAPSEQSFAPTTPGMVPIAQPLDLGPQCYLIDSEADCQSTSGCEFNYDNGRCQSKRLSSDSPATITMPGDCSPGSPYGDLVTQVIAKFDGISWIPLTTCTDYNDIGGGRLSCLEEDGRTTIWDTNPGVCTITAQTWSFSPFVVTGYSMQYCSTQQLSSEGSHTVNYRATDTYGNTGSGSDTVKIDLYPPSTLAQLTGVLGEQGWYTSNVVVDFVASDSSSGVNATYYSLDNETWNAWAGPDTLAFSEKSMLYYYSEDNAGLKENVRTVFVAIDKTGPEISVGETGTEGNAPWWVSILDVTINATDTESGMKELCSALGVEAMECVQAQ